MPTVTVSVKLIQMECGECGSIFGVSESKYDRCKQRGEGWYCPNGHSRVFAESEIQRLEKKLAKERENTEWHRKQNQRISAELEHVEAQRRAQVGVTTKLKKRLANGVCPCCNRSFANLARHMKGQHPGFERAD